MKSLILGVILTLTLSAPAAATDIEPGFSESTLNFAPPVLSVSATLSTGQLLVFDGVLIERYSSNGLLLQTFATLPAFVFPSFLVVSPQEGFAVAGESTFGDVFRIDLITGAVTTLANVALNYDAVIDGSGDVFVSAAATAFGLNDLVRIDPFTGVTELVAQVPGFSGPVALRPNGDLLLALADAPNRVIRYTPAQLAGSTTLGESDGVLVTTGWNGITDMIVDPETNELYIAESDFVNFMEPSMLFLSRPSKPFAQPIATAAPGETLGGLELLVDTGNPEVLAPFQPATGGVLRFSRTDFATLLARSELRPVRPTSSLSGPGVNGVGAVHYVVNGAYPNGVIWILFGPAQLFDPNEVPLVFSPGGMPLFWGLHLQTQRFLPFLFPTDANGDAAFSFYNVGNLNGLLAFQSAIGDADAILLGSATGSSL